MQGRILHLSDIHFGCENREALEGVAELAASEPFDLTAITGDVTQFGRRREFVAAAAWIGNLPGPKLITPGNHDVPYATPGRIFDPFDRYRRFLGPPWKAIWQAPTIIARTFNSARGWQLRWNWSKGVVRPEHVTTAAEDLADAAGDKLRVALCHHPLIEVTGGPMTGEVQGGEWAVKELGRAGVDLLLTGHVHTAFAHELPTAGGGLYAIGAGTLSRRERGQPAGFNIIEWDKGCIRVRCEGWTGSHFETQRTWALPRR
jgi:3',5'-cyclic AMP phosphodiesterase CpdA